MQYSYPTAEPFPINSTSIFDDINFNQPPSDIFKQILPLVGEQLQCDRVFVYLRSPRHHVGRVPFCWRRRDGIPAVYDPDWKPEPRWLPRQDPMFAAALKGQPSLFIDDVETVNPKLVNRNFERQTFGHRALVHAHLYQNQKLWGILQPCVFDRPRQWDQADRLFIKQTVDQLTPVAMDYVITHDR
jgi:GAF domain-containing protein